MHRLDLHQFKTGLMFALLLAICIGVAASAPAGAEAPKESEDNTMFWSLTLKMIRARVSDSRPYLDRYATILARRISAARKPPAVRRPRTRGICRQPSAGCPASPLERRGPKSAPRNTIRPAYCFVLFRGVPLVRTCPVSNEEGIYRGLQSGRIDLRLGKRGATGLPGKRAGKGRPSL